MKFLVVGNSVLETVERTEDGGRRHHTGGVGAIMARELALAGEDTTFLTTLAPDRSATRMVDNLTADGVKVHTTQGTPPMGRNPEATLYTRNGGPIRASGRWGRPTEMGEILTRTAACYDCTLVSMTLSEGDYDRLNSAGKKLVGNATSKRAAPQMHLLKGPMALTMNEAEARTVLGRGQNPNEALGAPTVLITSGRKGRTLYQSGSEPQHTGAAEPPPGTDYIGAGDAATAGLAVALAHGHNVEVTVNQFIADLLLRNAQAYRQN